MHEPGVVWRDAEEQFARHVHEVLSSLSSMSYSGRSTVDEPRDRAGAEAPLAVYESGGGAEDTWVGGEVVVQRSADSHVIAHVYGRTPAAGALDKFLVGEQVECNSATPEMMRMG